MTTHDDDTTRPRVARTSTGALDHAAIEARARQLRREALSALLNVLARRVARAWAVMTRRPSAGAWRDYRRTAAAPPPAAVSTAHGECAVDPVLKARNDRPISDHFVPRTSMSR
jgi:hypothetical protein